MFCMTKIGNFGNTMKSFARTSAEPRAGHLAIGSGLSYSDSIISSNVFPAYFNMTPWIRVADDGKSIIVSGSRTIEDTIKSLQKIGKILPVVPGTSKVTIGGAIAHNIHGKNQSFMGSFCDHVKSITLAQGNGYNNLLTISRDYMSDLFHATCAGMGLTGTIVSAEITGLVDRPSKYKVINQTANNIDEIVQQLDRHHDNRVEAYAWLNFSKNRKDNHSPSSISLCHESIVTSLNPLIDEYRSQDTEGLSIPKWKKHKIPKLLQLPVLNRYTEPCLSRLYFLNHKKKGSCHHIIAGVEESLFPLDRVKGWNNLYGSNGIIQFQALIPRDNLPLLKSIVSMIIGEGYLNRPFLASLKKMGPSESGNMTYAMDGYSLAVDLKCTLSNLMLVNRMIDEVSSNSGLIYPAKDAVASSDNIKAMFGAKYDKQKAILNGNSFPKIKSQQGNRYGFFD